MFYLFITSQTFESACQNMQTDAWLTLIFTGCTHTRHIKRYSYDICLSKCATFFILFFVFKLFTQLASF